MAVKWTFEALEKSASEHTTVRSWRETHPSAYATASQKGLLKKLTHHMSRERVPQNYWTYEKVIESAIPFNNKSDWMNQYPSAYTKAHKYGWLEAATKHMSPVGNKYYRFVYVIKVQITNQAYVGLTGNPKRRFKDHLKSKRFEDIIKRYGLDAIAFKVVTELLSPHEASRMEGSILRSLEQEGYQLLNKAKTGGLGGVDLKWSDEAILNDALQYDNVMDWANSKGGAYASASKKGLLKEATRHMKRQIRTPRTWTLDEVIACAAKFTSVKEWRKLDPSSYNAAKNHSWYQLPEVSGHLVRRVPKWTKEKILTDAQKYNSRTEWYRNSAAAVSAAKRLRIYNLATEHMVSAREVSWSKRSVLDDAAKYFSRSSWKAGSGGAYAAAIRNGWLQEATSHMKVLNPIGKWSSVKAVLLEARKYKTKSEWQSKSVGSYEAAKKLDIFKQATSHMVLVRESWSKERILQEAKRYQSKPEWKRQSPKSYNAAYRLKIVSEASRHMDVLNPVGFWKDKQNVLDDAAKYQTRTEWYHNSAGAYASAKRNGWFEEAVQHMK